MVLGTFREYLRIDVVRVHTASYQAIWSGVFISASGLTALLIASAVFVVVEIDVGQSGGVVGQYIGAQTISAITSLLLIIPAAYLFKAAADQASKDFSKIRLPAEIFFGFILALAGFFHFITFGIGVNISALLNEESLFIIIVLHMAWGGITVASTGMIVSGIMRMLVGIKALTVDSIYERMSGFVNGVLRPLYQHYRLLVCIGYMQNKTIFESHIYVLKHGEKVAIDLSLQ